MPGIYINDGGAMSSSLGSALGRIAQNFTPEAQAQAQLLQEQTKAAMWKNRGYATDILAHEQEVAAARALAGATNAEINTYNYTPPTGPVSPVAAAVANSVPSASPATDPPTAPNMAPAAPPGTPANTQQDSMSPGGETYRGASNANPSGSSPHGVMADLVAGYVARGASADQILSLINFGQSIHAGPGRGFQEQNTIATTRAAPFALGPGQQRYDPAAPPPATMGSQPSQQPVINQPAQQVLQPGQPGQQQPWQPPGQQGQPSGQVLLSPSMIAVPNQPGQPGQGGQPAQGAAPGTQPTAAGWQPSVTAGPSIYTQKAQEEQVGKDIALFNSLSDANAGAYSELQQIKDLRALHDQLSTGTMTGQAWQAWQQHLFNEYHFNLSNSGAAQAEIDKRIVEMVGTMRDQFGNFRPNAASMGLVLRGLPSSQMTPEVFHDVMSTLEANAIQKIRSAEVARGVLPNLNPATAQAGRDALNNIAMTDPTAAIRAQHPNLFGNVGSGASGGPASAAAGAGGAGAGVAPEGTIAHTAKGDLVKRNGQWQPVQ